MTTEPPSVSINESPPSTEKEEEIVPLLLLSPQEQHRNQVIRKESIAATLSATRSKETIQTFFLTGVVVFGFIVVSGITLESLGRFISNLSVQYNGNPWLWFGFITTTDIRLFNPFQTLYGFGFILIYYMVYKLGEWIHGVD